MFFVALLYIAIYMATSELRVTKLTPLGKGSYKDAFTIVRDETNNPHNFTIPAGSDVANFCLVEYSNAINWRKESSFQESFIEFRTEMKNNPQFKYDIEEKGISLSRQLIFNKNLYSLHKDQFDCIAELKKLHELAPRFAPVLHQIRIDVNKHDGSTTLGTPFSPEEMDSKFAETPSGLVKVSYLIERCGDNIIKYVNKNPNKKDAVAQKIIKFVDSYVDTNIELLYDIKPENFCTQIVDGKIESIRMLDVDTKYCFKCNSHNPAEIEEFKRHAKVFMKYALITYSIRWGNKIDGTQIKIDFGNLGVTPEDVDAMLAFFYTQKYMIHKYNPINMLYHYFIELNPSAFLLDHLTEEEKLHIVPEVYDFLYYDRLKKYIDIKKLIEIFKKRYEECKITFMKPNMGEGGGGKEGSKEGGGGGKEGSKEGGGGGKEGDKEEGGGGKSMGGRKKRKSKKRVNKKRKRTRKN